ncbi:DUF664 domain-containing protein [Luedemannella flava]
MPSPAGGPRRSSGSTSRAGRCRGLLLHVITETATHAGHLDAVRELIDGRTWFVVED